MNVIEEFKKDLQKLGLKQGDTVMIHCSYKSLGADVSPELLFGAITELLGEDGTLVMPAFSYRTVNYENPVFDVDTTPSCVGFLPEFFRTEVKGVKRSLHATHSCCVLGKNSDFLIKDHELDLTPVGENSPITKLPDLDGKILILGSHPDHNTTLHGVEEKGKAPYVFDPERTIDYVLKNGKEEIRQTARRHDFHKADCDYEQKYARILEILSDDDYAVGKVLNADCYLMSARAVWEKGVAKLKEAPYFFVERVYKEG